MFPLNTSKVPYMHFSTHIPLIKDTNDQSEESYIKNHLSKL